MSNQDKQNRDNRANQLNPNNDAYWQSRGEPSAPESESVPPAPSSSPSTTDPTKPGK